MKIIHFYSENIKKLKAVEIKPEGNTIIITGKNGQGKSSVIDSIAMVLGGKKLMPEKPVRDGETTAKIEIQIGPYIVTRNWTNPETSYLKVANEDGAKFTNGQSILNALIGDLTFDPLEFANKESKAQVDILKKICKLDFDKLDAEHALKFASRRDVKRDGDRLSARIEDDFKDLPEELDPLTSVDEIKADKEKAEKYNAELEGFKRAYLTAGTKVESVESELKKVMREKLDFEQRIKDNAAYQDKLRITLKEMQGKQAKLKEDCDAPMADPSVFDKQLEEHYALKTLHDKVAKKADSIKELDLFRKDWRLLNERLTAIDTEKVELLKAAKMPVKGLSLGVGQILFNEIPFGQISMAEKIKVSIGIAAFTNPKLRVAMIYNGSLLDNDTLAEVSQMAKDYDMQLWVEKVADSPDGNNLFIEDGELVK